MRKSRASPRPRWRIPAPLMLVFSEVASFYLSRFHPDFPQRFTPGAIRPAEKAPPCRHRQGEAGARLPADQHPRRGA